jgi:HPt (histidine-containing phosphotransfer) domain-containing protein
MNSQIDLTVFEDLRRMTDADFVHQLVDTFLEDTPALFIAMKAALEAGKPEDFRRAAHSVKSNAATFGAGGLSDMARELERLGRENQLDAAGSRLQEMETLYQSVAEELRGLANGQ